MSRNLITESADKTNFFKSRFLGNLNLYNVRSRNILIFFGFQIELFQNGRDEYNLIPMKNCTFDYY